MRACQGWGAVGVVAVMVVAVMVVGGSMCGGGDGGRLHLFRAPRAKPRLGRTCEEASHHRKHVDAAGVCRRLEMRGESDGGVQRVCVELLRSRQAGGAVGSRESVGSRRWSVVVLLGSIKGVCACAVVAWV